MGRTARFLKDSFAPNFLKREWEKLTTPPPLPEIPDIDTPRDIGSDQLDASGFEFGAEDEAERKARRGNVAKRKFRKGNVPPKSPSSGTGLSIGPTGTGSTGAKV